MEVFCDAASVPTSQRGFWQCKNVCEGDRVEGFLLGSQRNMLMAVCMLKCVWEPVCLCVCVYSLWWKIEVAGVLVDGVGWCC